MASRKDLAERTAKAMAAYRAAIDEVIAAAPELVEGRQEGHENLVGNLESWKRNSEWLEGRVAGLVDPKPTSTKEGVARRRKALAEAKAAGDEKEVQRLQEALKSLGVEV
jgi:hypothetical protein